jgi:putative transposase
MLRIELVPEGRLPREERNPWPIPTSQASCIASFPPKQRRNAIAADRLTDLWSYLGGIARKNGFKAIAIGGTENHVHLLLSLPAAMPLSKAMQLIKGGSSKWMNDNGADKFAWQEGYGAFTLGISQRSNTIRYINTQAEHHKKVDFDAEFVAFLKKHGIDYDPKYVLGSARSRPSGD